MSKLISLIGKRFERLVVLERGPKLHGRISWKCLCDCGNIKIVTSSDLRFQKVKSCGCLRKESAVLNSKKSIKHNRTKTRIYHIWSSIKSRCYYRENIGYLNYGGKGVKVCEEWLKDFMNFYNWAMNNGYQDNLTIDRIDVNGDYEPQNCRWVSYKIQENNRTNNRIIKYNDKTYTVAELANFLQIPYATLLWRINNGWNEKELGLKPNLANKNRRKKEK